MLQADRPGLAGVFVSIDDPRQAGKVEDDLVEMLVVAVSAVLSGADTFVESEAWATEKLDWLRNYLQLKHGIASHDTFGRLFGLIDPAQFEAALRRWVESVVPVLGAQVVAIDGKTSRRSGQVDATPLHLVSAFAADARLVLGQHSTAAKSNEKTAILQLLEVLALQGCIVTVDAMGPQASIAQAIRQRGADHVLVVQTTSLPWPRPSGISSRAARPRPTRPHIRSSRRWKRITGAWRSVATMRSMPCSACLAPSSGRI